MILHTNKILFTFSLRLRCCEGSEPLHVANRLWQFSDTIVVAAQRLETLHLPDVCKQNRGQGHPQQQVGVILVPIVAI